MGTSSERIGAFEIRPAEPSDVDEIALAHRESIQSIGPAVYSPEVVEFWWFGPFRKGRSPRDSKAILVSRPSEELLERPNGGVRTEFAIIVVHVKGFRTATPVRL